jgi:hypothetical protein
VICADAVVAAPRVCSDVHDDSTAASSSDAVTSSRRRCNLERMKWYVHAVAATAIAVLATRAVAEPLAVVVRDGGSASLAIDRLRGQLADLEVTVTVVRGVVEASLEVQLAIAARLAAAHDARAVVWFVAHGGGLAVAIATPREHRLFVREIPAADPSAVAEAAAVAARGALRAIAEGGTIGVEIPAKLVEVVPVETAPSSPGLGLELGVGWQVALDAGADAGAQAIALRTSATRQAWAVALALGVGPALRHAAGADVAVELSRSDAALGIERRFGGFALGVSAGAILYRRTTLATPAGLMPTDATTTIALAVGPELRWRWRPWSSRVGIEVCAGLDVVLGAPELAVVRNGTVESLGQLRRVQPRLGLSIVAGLP